MTRMTQSKRKIGPSSNYRRFHHQTIMIFAAIVALLADLTSALLAHPPLSCSYKENVGANNMVLFTSPNWPGPYAGGEVCRWLFTCDEGYVCHLQCRDVGLPQSKGCFMDKLMVSRSGGDPMFRNARKYCGTRRINIRSIGSMISIGLVTSHRTPGGRFKCLVKTVSKRKETTAWHKTAHNGKVRKNRNILF